MPAAKDRQLKWICVLLIDQPFGCANEIVEDVLLVGEHSGLMRGFAEFTSPTEVDLRRYATVLRPNDGIRPELRRDVDRESAITGQKPGRAPSVFMLRGMVKELNPVSNPNCSSQS